MCCAAAGTSSAVRSGRLTGGAPGTATPSDVLESASMQPSGPVDAAQSSQVYVPLLLWRLARLTLPAWVFRTADQAQRLSVPADSAELVSPGQRPKSLPRRRLQGGPDAAPSTNAKDGVQGTGSQALPAANTTAPGADDDHRS